MKIIISHDVDHLYRKDHYKDTFFIKRIIRSILQCLKKELTFKGGIQNIKGIFAYKQHHIDEVMAFDNENNIPSTFFFGMEKGLGMHYSREAAIPVIKKVQQRGFSVGVHGIAYNDIDSIIVEYERFKQIVGDVKFGIRTHYVRCDDITIDLFSEVGYLFDTSEFDKRKGCSLKRAYKVGNMWEFPLCLMDGYLPRTLQEKKQRTIELILKAEEARLEYFTVLFHDYLFCDAFADMKEWYVWLIEYLRNNDYEFISYFDAINEMEKE